MQPKCIEETKKISEKLNTLHLQQNTMCDIICDIHSHVKLLNDISDLESIETTAPINMQTAIDSLISKNASIYNNLENIIIHLKNNL